MDYKRIDASQIEALWKLQRLYKEEIKEDEPDLAGKERMTEAIKANSILFFGAYDEKALIGCCSVTVGFQHSIIFQAVCLRTSTYSLNTGIKA